MYRGLVLLLAILATAYGNVIVPKAPMLDGRIVGGESTDIEKFPYQVSVRLLGGHTCGGSILNSKVVLTAAHCIYSIGAQYYSIQYGSTQVGGGKTITAERLVKHEKYDSNVIDFDVALIFLQSEIQFSNVAQPIPLASKSPPAGTKAVVSGWGTTSEGGSSPSTLQKVDVAIVGNDDCAAQYDGFNEITAQMLCAGVVGGGKDACQGDSGGPLAANGELVGIVSWGVGCARPEFAGVYSNVATLLPWINEKTK